MTNAQPTVRMEIHNSYYEGHRKPRPGPLDYIGLQKASNYLHKRNRLSRSAFNITDWKEVGGGLRGVTSPLQTMVS